jgi:hypothetical protein
VFGLRIVQIDRGIRPAGGGKGPVDLPGEKPGLTEPSCRAYSVALGSL